MSKSSNETAKAALKDRALSSLEFFINLIHPQRMLGNSHREVITWMTREGAKSHQLLLLPRDHQKSALMAYRVAWEITKNPAIRILYLSATSTLAVKQLDFIKEILTCDTYRFYWPEMVNRDKSKRKKWTETEISVDHPKRKEETIRDSTVFTAGLTTTVTGLHCDVAVLDDIVIDDNAYSKTGREEVATQASYLGSIVGTDGRVWATGTRYQPEDYYYEMMNTFVDQYDEGSRVISQEPLYEIYEKRVEDRGDGTGNFLWPRMQRSDGKWFGFDRDILAVKRASYKDFGKYKSQYYNDPSTVGGTNFSRENFQYYEKRFVSVDQGTTYYKDKRLNVFAAMDFAYSTKDRSDYTCIVVIGIDCFNNIYILDVDRFKTGKISEYYSHLLSLHQKWGFRKVSCEITAAQSVIVKDLKDNYIRKNGLALSLAETRPTTQKADRIEATLQPRYNNMQIWHYVGGGCELLEEELLASRPQHDDIKDALSCAVEISVAPSQVHGRVSKLARNQNHKYNLRFGGVAS